MARSRTKSLGNVLAPLGQQGVGGRATTPTRSIQGRSLSVCAEDAAAPHRGTSPSGAALRTRKASVVSLGEHLSTLMSMSTQVCTSLGEKVVSSRPPLSANDIADNIIMRIRSSMKDREGHQIPLPDYESNGVRISEGQLTGLTNISRWGEAALDERPDKIYLSLTLLVKDLYAVYSWKRKKLKGQFSTKIDKIFFHLKIRQDMSGSSCPDVTDYSVKNLEGLSVGLHGLGPLNWIAKKVLLGMVQQSITNIMEAKGKEIIRSELERVSILDQISFSIFTPKIL